MINKERIRIKSILGMIAFAIILICFSPVNAIIQNDVTGDGGSQVDQSNAANGFLLENAQPGALDGDVTGGLILLDNVNNDLKSIVNDNGVLKINTGTELIPFLTGSSNGMTTNGLTITNGTLINALIENSNLNVNNGQIILTNGSSISFNGSFLQNALMNGDTIIDNGSLVITTSAPSPGFVLTSDSNGLATWQAVPAGADDLGDHTASQDLDMNGNALNDATNITATGTINGLTFNGTTFNGTSFFGGTFNGTFLGNGSGLTGVATEGSTINNLTVTNGSISNGVITNTVYQGTLLLENGTTTVNNGTISYVNGATIDFNGASLQGPMNLSGTLTATTLAATTFNGGAFEGSSFTGGTFNGTYFGDGSNLTGVATAGSTINNLTLTNGTMSNGTVYNTYIDNGNITNGSVYDAYLDNGTIVNGTVSNSTFISNTINGVMSFGSSGMLEDAILNGTTLISNGDLYIRTSNPQNGYVLTSDENGKATWTSSASLAGTGDNLGSHTATETLQMSGEDILNAGTINGVTANFTNLNVSGTINGENFLGGTINGANIINSTVDLTYSVDIKTLSPLDDSTGHAVDDDLIITFDTIVIKDNGNLEIREVAGDILVETIDVTSNKVSLANNVVTINPDTTLDYSTAYYVTSNAGTLVSAVDTVSEWAGINDSTTWNFTTEAPPTIAVSSVNPSDNATGVSRTASPSITFNVPVTLNAGNATILYSSDSSNFETISLLSGQVTLSNGDRTVNINPTSNFAYSTGYYIEIDAGVIENSHTPGDYFGGYSGTSAWNFTSTAIPATTINETLTLDASPDYDTATSTVDLTDIGGTESDVTTVTITNNKVAGDSTTVITFNTTTNKPSSVTLPTGEVQAISTDPVDNSTRFVIENQQYSFYVDGSNNIVFTNEPSGIGVFTARTLTVELTNQ